MADLPADSSTTAIVAVGGSCSDSLELVGDRDWIAVTLTAGQTYTITLTATGASPLDDPYLYFTIPTACYCVRMTTVGPLSSIQPSP